MGWRPSRAIVFQATLDGTVRRVCFLSYLFLNIVFQLDFFFFCLNRQMFLPAITRATNTLPLLSPPFSTLTLS